MKIKEEKNKNAKSSTSLVVLILSDWFVTSEKAFVMVKMEMYGFLCADWFCLDSLVGCVWHFEISFLHCFYVDGLQLELNPSVDHIFSRFVLYFSLKVVLVWNLPVKKCEEVWKTYGVFSHISWKYDVLFFFPNKPSKPQFIVKKYEFVPKRIFEEKDVALVFCRVLQFKLISFPFHSGQSERVVLPWKYVACSLFQMNLHRHTWCIKYECETLKILEGKRSVFLVFMLSSVDWSSFH